MNDKQISEVITNCNKQAIERLKEEDFAGALKSLKKAQSLLTEQSSPKDNNLLAITLNNFGCYYKKLGKPSISLQFLQKALELKPSSASDRVNLAGTHLNICSLRSQLGNHEAAVEHARTAFSLLESGQELTMVIALHNLAIEYEFLSKIPEALDTYRKALDLAQPVLGEQHEITKSLYNNYIMLSDTSKLVTHRKAASYNKHTLPSIKQKASSSNKRKIVTPARHSTSFSFSRPKTYQSKGKIEKKLDFLQKQLNVFEKKYELLEMKHREFIASRANTSQGTTKLPRLINTQQDRKAALIIQKYWRGYVQRSQYGRAKREKAFLKAQNAIRDLEDLKKIAIMEDIFEIPEIPRPNTNQVSSPITVLPSMMKTENKFFTKHSKNLRERDNTEFSQTQEKIKEMASLQI